MGTEFFKNRPVIPGRAVWKCVPWNGQSSKGRPILTTSPMKCHLVSTNTGLDHVPTIPQGLYQGPRPVYRIAYYQQIYRIYSCLSCRYREIIIIKCLRFESLAFSHQYVDNLKIQQISLLAYITPAFTWCLHHHHLSSGVYPLSFLMMGKHKFLMHYLIITIFLFLLQVQAWTILFYMRWRGSRLVQEQLLIINLSRKIAYHFYFAKRTHHRF